MPITHFELIGNWDKGPQYKWNYQDVACLTKGKDKIIRLFDKTPHNFNFYFVKNKFAQHYLQYGRVNEEWVKENLKCTINQDNNALTVIFTNNIAFGKIPMTAWTMVHRLGHLLYNYNWISTVQNTIQKMVETVYNLEHADRKKTDKAITAFVHSIGTMKSARDGNIRIHYEFPYELMAQYILSKVKFNQIPHVLKLDNRKAWGRPNPTLRYANKELLDQCNDTLKYYEGLYESDIEITLGALLGKILVM